jgi:Flp pilus assembly protein TadD
MEAGDQGQRRPAGLKAPATRAESKGVTNDRARRAGRLVVAAFLLTLGGVASARAQAGDVPAEARTAAIAGRRTEAVEMLQRHLTDSPRDADARLLLGVVLSWDGKYDEADRELRRVLEQSPTYNDARVALANVAWWTGRYDVLRELGASSGPMTSNGSCSRRGRSTAWDVRGKRGRRS